MDCEVKAEIIFVEEEDGLGYGSDKSPKFGIV